MKELWIYALEVLACSGVLLAAYTILLERRVAFRWCRIYLIATTVLAALIPLLRIPIWPGEVITAGQVAVGDDWAMAEVLTAPTPQITPRAICMTVYLLGAALITTLMCWQIIRIRNLRRGAQIIPTKRFSIVRTPKQIASFSFFRSIYLWRETPDEQTPAILAHEASHIAHRHSIERIVMESLKALLWWNPFVWITARRLTEAEEFEADSDVLQSGYDLGDYMNTLFKQLLGYSPDIANGLRDSLTKKRFQMMTTKTKNRHTLLRLAGTLPVVIGLLCTFGFTSRAAVIAPAAETIVAEQTTLVAELPAADIQTPQTPAPKAEAATEKAPAQSKPLYIIDGIEHPSMDNINPNSIESVTVLKSHTAIGLYGERGVNGVVAITTKDNKGLRQIAKEIADEEEFFQKASTKTSSGEYAFHMVEVMPSFQGGDLNDYRRWVQTQVRYPSEALGKKLQGRVAVTFVVGKDGTVSDVVTLQSPDKIFSDEVTRVIAKTPAGAWTPGKQKGVPVAVKYTLPVDFRVMDNTKEQPAKEQVTQSGTVLDDSRNPIVGATVVMSGTERGVTTDKAGKFSIQAERGATLNVAFVGVASAKVEVTGTPIEIVLPKAKSMDEVVVVGYGTAKK